MIKHQKVSKYYKIDCGLTGDNVRQSLGDILPIQCNIFEKIMSHILPDLSHEKE